MLPMLADELIWQFHDGVLDAGPWKVLDFSFGHDRSRVIESPIGITRPLASHIEGD